MDDAGLLDAELDSAALRGFDGAGDVHGHGADLGVRHHAARAQHLAEPPHQGHQVGRCNAAVEINVTAIDAFDQILGPNDVGARGARLISLGTACTHGNSHGAASAVRKRHDAANHLVGMAGVDAKIHGDLDGFVEFRLGPLLDHLYGLIEGVELFPVDALPGLQNALPVARHDAYSLTSRPIERAEPSIIRIADSMVSQLRSFIFCSAISFTCARVTVPALSRPGALAPASMLAAFLRKKETGGVFISNVKERSAYTVMTT